MQADGGGDIALLRLGSTPPDGAKVARLAVVEDLWGHTFRAFGFPDNHDDGQWASGRLLAREAKGWIQIEDVKETGHRVQGGYSGGAVWDEQLDGVAKVAGMVVAADEDASKVAYIIPSKVLINALPQLGPQAILPCPYKGLLAFREQDAPFFFGRKTFIDQLVEITQRQSVAIILGSSGSGKSSVVFAGLLPQLRQKQACQIAHFRPGNHPFQVLATALIPLLEPAMSETDRLLEIKKLAEGLERGDLTLRAVVERLMQKHAASLLLIADQFEELYTLCTEAAIRHQFLDTLLEAVGLEDQQSEQYPRLTLVLTLRADFLGQALDHHFFADTLQDAMLILKPMNYEQLKEVIEKPAQKAGVTFAPGLVERILNDIENEPNALPLLEFALTLLWDQQEGKQLTHQAYDAIGRIKGALTRYADQVYDPLHEDEKKQMRRVFMQMVRPGEGTVDTRRIATREELGEDGWATVRQLSNTRLVVTGTTTDGQESAELVHEALIQNWQQLQTWLTADRTFLVWQERFRIALRQWQENQQDEGTLLRGALLAEAVQWYQERDQEFTATERMYLCHSILNTGESADIHEWQSRYGTIDDTLAYSDTYGEIPMDALRWLPADDQDDEVCYQLQQYVLHDRSPEAREYAALSIYERGHISHLAELLASQELTKRQRERLIDALAYACNFPRVKDEVQRTLQHSKTTVLNKAKWRFFSDYRRLFLLILFSSYLLGQITLLLTARLCSIFRPNDWSLSQNDIGALTVEVFNVAITLSIGLYVFMRRRATREEVIDFKECFNIGVIFTRSIGFLEVAVFLEVALIGSIIANTAFLSALLFSLWDASVYLSINIAGMSIIALSLLVFFKNRIIIWKLFLIALLGAGIEMLFQKAVITHLFFTSNRDITTLIDEHMASFHLHYFK